MFPTVLSGQVCKLAPTQSIKRCETYSGNVSCNQWKQGSAHCNLASKRHRDQSKYLALAEHPPSPAGHGCNPCTHEARSTRAHGKEKKQLLAGLHASQNSLLSGLLTKAGWGKHLISEQPRNKYDFRLCPLDDTQAINLIFNHQLNPRHKYNCRGVVTHSVAQYLT